MGARGKQSASALSVASSTVAPLLRRPDPWPGLSDRESELWKSITNAQSVDWFSPGDMPILAAYCRSIALHERASLQAVGASLTVFGAAGGEIVNPILKVQDMAARQIAGLAVKLRLSQSAKWTEQKAATKNAQGKTANRPWE